MHSSQSKGSNAGFAAVEGLNAAAGLSTFSLNNQINYAVSWQPQFEKTITQSDNIFID